MNYLRYCRCCVEEYGLDNAYNSSQQKWMIDETAKYFNISVEDVLLKSIGYTTIEEYNAKQDELLSDLSCVVNASHVAKLFWRGYENYNLQECNRLKHLASDGNSVSEYQNEVIKILNEHVMYCDDVDLAIFCADCKMYINSNIDINNVLKAILMLGTGVSLPVMICRDWLDKRFDSHSYYRNLDCGNQLVKEFNSLMGALCTDITSVSPYCVPVDKYLDSKHMFNYLDTNYISLTPLMIYDKPVDNVIIPAKSLESLYASCKLQDVVYEMNEKSGKYVALLPDGTTLKKYVSMF